LAFGFSTGLGNDITSSAQGSIALGDASLGSIVASANSTLQLGPGTNSVANSLNVGAVGLGVHLHGDGFPAGPANGDLWNGGGTMGLRSNGQTFTFDQQATIADPAGGATVDAEARTAINALIDAVQALGLVA